GDNEAPREWAEGAWNGSVRPRFAGRRRGRDDQVVARAAEAIAAATRPLVIAGGGARRAHADVERFVEFIHSPLATTANGKGILSEDHPLSLGSNVRFPSVQAESAAADVLIVLGSELA